MKWNINEEKDLINGVTSCKKYNLPIKNAFISHGKKYDRSMLSVKNHYYKLTKNANDCMSRIIANYYSDIKPYSDDYNLLMNSIKNVIQNWEK